MNEAGALAGAERHDLVWLAPGALAGARWAGHANCASLGLDAAKAARQLASWVGRGHPLIVARQPHGIPAGLLAVGLALPPQEGKHRLSFLVDASALRRRCRPPLLREARHAFPARWQALAGALLANAAIDTAAPRIIGSAGMQLLTGEPCIGPDSDLDLLCTAHDWPQALHIARALAAVAHAHPRPRLDGELRAHDGHAIAWREVAARPARLLVKGLHGLNLADESAVAALFCSAVAVPA